MAHGPDWSSDSDDSLFADDGDYVNFKNKFKCNNSYVNGTSDQHKGENDKIRLLNAISAGNIADVKELISKGIDLQADLRDGWTAIFLATSSGNLDIIQLLIENGADINQDRDGVTLLMMACSCPPYTVPYEKSFQVAKFLVEKGANVKAINKKKMDALMYAACSGNLLVVKYLLDKANKEAVDNQRWNALTWAVSNNQPEVVKCLYEAGFAIDLADVRGSTAVDMAKENCLDEISNIFPKRETDLVEEILSLPSLTFEEHFRGLRKNEKPIFFEDLSHFLLSVKCGHFIPLFLDRNVSLACFLSFEESDLKNLGIRLPYQRNRILAGLHRFHKQPYLPKSLHVCVKSSTYSNVDVAIQLMSAIKQVMSMEAGLKYLMKHLEEEKLSNEDRKEMVKSIIEIKSKISKIKPVVKKLQERLQQWDGLVVPVDLITKNSVKNIDIKQYFLTKKICLGFCVGIVSVLLIRKFKS